MPLKKSLQSFLSFLIILGIVVGASVTHVELVFAAALSSITDTQSSLKANTLSDHTIQFVTPTGISAGQTISLTFQTGFTMGTFAVGNFDLATSTNSSCTFISTSDAVLSTSASGLTWGVSQATNSVYIVSGTAVIPANRCIQVEIGANATSSASGVSQITNPVTPGSYAIAIRAGVDTGTSTQNIITDDTVVISATVQQSFSFTLSTSSIYFGSLGSGAPKYASSTNGGGDTIETVAHTLQVSTNAPSGYTISIRGQTLTSQQDPAYTITAIGATAASSNFGTEQFGIRATSAGGTGASIDATYSQGAQYGFDATATTSAPFASGSGATDTTTYSLRYIANIGGFTEAGSYVASLVYVATANY